MFLETWDDPATLSRVWCLEELRVAMLMGKKVRICMPFAAMKAFRERAKKNSRLMVQDIEKVLDRISIEHASATFDRNRQLAFEAIDVSVGRQAFDWFAKDIVRESAAADGGLPSRTTARVRRKLRAEQCEEIFAEMLANVGKA